jgi:hypothetical protein
MPRVNSKAEMTINLKVNNRNGNTLGHLVFTSGHLDYYRKKARKVTKRVTLAKLIKLIQKESD